MFKTAAIILSVLFLGSAVFGFLNFKMLGESSSCGFACPLTNGVFASSASSGNGTLAGSAFAVIVILLLAFGIALIIGLPVGDRSAAVSTAAEIEELSNLVFKKITFWFSLHEASPTK
ncbi:hypothetical protein M1413_01965 [Patescibacteria group bacterium]|nr:hypothetical protein [Patescibacteria group bacterium]MCL5114395.1 hypothetical protein [Patescibacteria group bacterium]